MEISRETLGTVEVLRARGRLVLGPPSREFEERTKDLVASGARRIVLDLSGIDYIDSAGLGTLIGCVGAAREAGAGLRLAAVTDRVRQILRITATEKVLPLDADVAASVAALG
jgi:anti-sigma B factor antagonist